MKTNKYLAKVNEFEFELDTVTIQNLDLIEAGKSTYHLLEKHQSHNIHIQLIDEGQKKVELSVNGNKYEVQLADAYDQLVDKMGLTLANTQKVKEIKAPMPGLVLDVQVEVGKTVQEGETLLILEAMKMENALQAPGEGIVKSIEVKKGQAVEKGQLLIAFE